MMYGAGRRDWKEFYRQKKSEERKANLILLYFGVVIITYLVIIGLGV